MAPSVRLHGSRRNPCAASAARSILPSTAETPDNVNQFTVELHKPFPTIGVAIKVDRMNLHQVAPRPAPSAARVEAFASIPASGNATANPHRIHERPHPAFARGHQGVDQSANAVR